MVSAALIVPIKLPHVARSTKWSWFDQSLLVWKRLQVSYCGGKYSIHRLLALEEYTRNTSLLRVIFVCIGTPLPTVTIILIQESIPLQDPTKGWQENYGFWIRAAILAIVIARVVADQTRYFINDVSISWVRVVMVCICTSVFFTAVAAFVSAHLIFPVPFFVLTLAPVFYLVYVFSFCVVVGRRALHQILASREQLIQYICFLGAQNIMACAYPAYEALFRLTQGTRYQLPVIFLLPVIKVALRNLMIRCAVHMEDMIPEAVIFTVDFFNAVYVSSCMQSATSLVAVTAIIATDLSQTAIVLYGLHRRTERILQSLQHAMGTVNKPLGNYSLLSAPCSLCWNPDEFEKQERGDIRVYSCLPHVLSTESKQLLDRLEKVTRPCGDPNRYMPGSIYSELSSPKKPHNGGRLGLHCLRNRVEAIHPVVVDAVKQPFSSSRGSRDALTKSMSFTNHKVVLREVLEALFSIECLVVTAYLEAATPILYCCYVLVMVHLPSSRYHAEMVGMTSENVGSKVFSLLVFGLFQVASFILLALVLKRNCGMNLLQHFAFVMETQTSLIQGKLVAWLVVTLCFRVVHFGDDFTFQFAG